ncbi:MAG TPA: YugN family protein [Chondromyces sp.]|nr:YugN family protein [Chondromyces sp.]
MRFENTGLENLQIDLGRLDYILKSHGFVLAGQWDYERVTYDHKFELKEGTYYLRVLGFASQGDIGSDDAIIELMTPLLGKHYYPHGVEYGDAEHFPSSLVKTCEQLLSAVKKDVTEFAL